MAWEISISAEGWTEIRAALEEWSRESLIEAIADDTFEAVYAKADDQHASRASAAERRGWSDCLTIYSLIGRSN